MACKFSQAHYVSKRFTRSLIARILNNTCLSTCCVGLTPNVTIPGCNAVSQGGQSPRPQLANEPRMLNPNPPDFRKIVFSTLQVLILRTVVVSSLLHHHSSDLPSPSVLAAALSPEAGSLSFRKASTSSSSSNEAE